MTFDYSKPRETAERQIKHKGKPAAIRRTVQTESAGTPWDPRDDTATTTDYACTVLEDYYNQFERANSLIGMTDRKVLISTEGLEIAPLASDLLVIDGVAHEIRSLMPLQPGETVLLYEAQVRF